MIVTCPECLGSGEDVTPSHACELCHGDGWIHKPDEPKPPAAMREDRALEVECSASAR